MVPIVLATLIPVIVIGLTAAGLYAYRARTIRARYMNQLMTPSDLSKESQI